MRNLLPVLTVVAAIMVLWYVAVVPMNAQWSRDQAARAGTELTFRELVADTMNQRRPRLPAPHQVLEEIWLTTWVEEVHGRRGIVATGSLSPRSLVYHSWVTFSATMLGFAMGAALGMALAVGITYSRAMAGSVMPWVIASQTIPIIAIAPMIIVILSSGGITGLVPKAVIAAYLAFFPVVVGMVKGLNAPEQHQRDLMRTWNAGGLQTFLRLRLPVSMPYLFASAKVAIAASVVGIIVGELPVQQGGLGTRLLIGSQFGNPMQVWAALFTAAVLAAALVGTVGLIERTTLRRMGMAR